MVMKTAAEVRNLMPLCLSIEDRQESIMFQIEEAAKHGHSMIITKSYHDNNESKEISEIFKKLGFKVTEYGFQLHISWG